jgi:starch synthase (maltosyl-transferring)
MTGRLAIDDVHPVVGMGDQPAKAVVGERVAIRATVWREGHDAVAGTVEWHDPDGIRRARERMTLVNTGLDRWEAVVTPDQPGLWTFRVDAWSDPWQTWLGAVRAKLAAGLPVSALANDLEKGARLLDRLARRRALTRTERALLRDAAADLRAEDRPLGERTAAALSERTGRIAEKDPLRELLTRGRTHHLWVDRERALCGSWYELFPRSTGGVDGRGRPVHGTFATAAAELPRIAGMGFDVVYLPPVHPVGEVNRKGANNSLVAAPGDVGSPWAVGSADGGHDAVHPDLGTLADFAAFVARARELRLEVALDLALQCAPDHPWVTAHPEWFTRQPDGSIAFAENPPKTYEDIYPLNFDNDPEGIHREILRVVRFWMSRGVRIFRVDNPHTKPVRFWERLIREIHATDPDVLFLAEAFTRPAVLQGLAKAGFTQSYTYFTWRTAKQEFTDYLTELAGETSAYLRPNFFVNTPDILHESLQTGGRPMFAVRAALAATLSPTWGVYSGFELYENQAVRPGSEEYLDSEKYQLRPRDYLTALARGDSLQPWITRLNELRREHPALRQLTSLHFHDIDNDQLLAFSKTDEASGDTVLCVITLDPSRAHSGTLRLDMTALGRDPDDSITVHDELGRDTLKLTAATPVRIDPGARVAWIVSWSGR